MIGDEIKKLLAGMFESAMSSAEDWTETGIGLSIVAMPLTKYEKEILYSEVYKKLLKPNLKTLIKTVWENTQQFAKAGLDVSLISKEVEEMEKAFGKDEEIKRCIYDGENLYEITKCIEKISSSPLFIRPFTFLSIKRLAYTSAIPAFAMDMVSLMRKFEEKD